MEPLDQSKLPAGSIVLFRKLTLWERHKQSLFVGLMIFVSLAVLTIYLLSRAGNAAHASPEGDSRATHSGLLINAQEKERSRLASEIHDDFSQRFGITRTGIGECGRSGLAIRRARLSNKCVQSLLEFGQRNRR